MEQINLAHPLVVNGQELAVLFCDTEAITVGDFAQAESRKAAAASRVSASAYELDYTMHLYLGLISVTKAMPEVSIEDVERVHGTDVSALMRVGRNFTTKTSVAVSEANTSEKRLETTPEPSPRRSKKSDGPTS